MINILAGIAKFIPISILDQKEFLHERSGCKLVYSRNSYVFVKIKEFYELK